jgi:hypothetical protein
MFQTFKNFLTNAHTWVLTATVVSGGITAFERVDTPTGIIAGVLTVILFICTTVVNNNQVAAAGAPKIS